MFQTSSPLVPLNQPTALVTSLLKTKSNLKEKPKKQYKTNKQVKNIKKRRISTWKLKCGALSHTVYPLIHAPLLGWI